MESGLLQLLLRKVLKAKQIQMTKAGFLSAQPVESQEVQSGTTRPAGPEREPGGRPGPGGHDHRGSETLPGA